MVLSPFITTGTYGNLHISLVLSVYYRYVLQDCYMYYEILGFYLLSTEMPFTILTT